MADDDDHVNDGALVAKLSQVLLSAECQRLNFRWGRQHITGHGFRTVVLALLDYQSTLFEADDDSTSSMTMSKPRITGGHETMIIHPHRDLHRVSNRRTIVHEATHAIQDAQLAGMWMWSLDEEATAYIAEWLYVIYSSPDRDHLRNNPDTARADRHHCARIACSLAGKDGATPDAAAMRRLGDAIYASPTYGSTCCCTPGPAKTALRPRISPRGGRAGARASPGRFSPTRLPYDQTA